MRDPGYGYAHNDPVLQIDPSGRFAGLVGKAAAAGVLGGLVTFVMAPPISGLLGHTMTHAEAVEAAKFGAFLAFVAALAPVAAMSVAIYSWVKAMELFLSVVARPNASSTQIATATGLVALAALGLGATARGVEAAAASSTAGATASAARSGGGGSVPRGTLQKIFEIQTGKGNFGIGQLTRSQADDLGRAFVGSDAVPILRNGQQIGLRSPDGLRVFRFPAEKKIGQAAGRVQANIEMFFVDAAGNKVKVRNAHIDIIP